MDKTKELIKSIVLSWTDAEQVAFCEAILNKISYKREKPAAVLTKLVNLPAVGARHVITSADYGWVGQLMEEPGIRHITRMLHCLGYGPMSLEQLRGSLYVRGVYMTIGQINAELRRHKVTVLHNGKLHVIRLLPMTSLEFVLRFAYNAAPTKEELIGIWNKMNPDLRPARPSMLNAYYRCLRDNRIFKPEVNHLCLPVSQ